MRDRDEESVSLFDLRLVASHRAQGDLGVNRHTGSELDSRIMKMLLLIHRNLQTDPDCAMRFTCIVGKDY